MRVGHRLTGRDLAANPRPTGIQLSALLLGQSLPQQLVKVVGAATHRVRAGIVAVAPDLHGPGQNAAAVLPTVMDWVSV